MFKPLKSNLPAISAISAVAAAVLAVASAAPSFAWGWGWSGNATEIANRDAVLANEIANDPGRMGGPYGQLASRQRAIRLQERNEILQNGGFLTDAQKRQLNAEEDNLQRQINWDRTH